MFKPNEIEAMPVILEGYFKELENRIMEDIVRRIKINSEITSTADLQMQRLSEMGASKKAIKDYIQQALQLSEQGIDDLYSGAIRKGYNSDRDLYTATGRDFIPYAENQQLQQLVEAVKKQTNSDIKNITQSMGFAVRQPDGKLTFQPIADYYQKTLDKAVLDITSGSFDYNTVLKRTVQEMTDSGLRWIDYASGYHNRVPVAVRRAVMTGVNQVTAKIAEQNMELLQTEYVEVSWHRGARPSHQVWQGKIYHWKEKAISRQTETTPPTSPKNPPTAETIQEINPLDIAQYRKGKLLKINPDVITQKRYAQYIKMRKVSGSSHELFISQEARNPEQAIMYYEKLITAVENDIIFRTGNMKKPQYVIVNGETQMSQTVVAAYYPLNNTIYLRDNTVTDDDMRTFQTIGGDNYLVCSENPKSSLMHELMHWYRDKYSRKIAGRNYGEYMKRTQEEILDFLMKVQYDIKSKISKYASDNICKSDLSLREEPIVELLTLCSYSEEKDEVMETVLRRWFNERYNK